MSFSFEEVDTNRELFSQSPVEDDDSSEEIGTVFSEISTFLSETVASSVCVTRSIVDFEPTSEVVFHSQADVTR